MRFVLPILLAFIAGCGGGPDGAALRRARSSFSYARLQLTNLTTTTHCRVPPRGKRSGQRKM